MYDGTCGSPSGSTVLSSRRVVSRTAHASDQFLRFLHRTLAFATNQHTHIHIYRSCAKPGLPDDLPRVKRALFIELNDCVAVSQRETLYFFFLLLLLLRFTLYDSFLLLCVSCGDDGLVYYIVYIREQCCGVLLFADKRSVEKLQGQLI